MKKEYREEGREEGRKEGIRAVITTCAQLGAGEDVMVERLMEGFGFTAQEARKALTQYRKNLTEPPNLGGSS